MDAALRKYSKYDVNISNYLISNNLISNNYVLSRRANDSAW